MNVFTIYVIPTGELLCDDSGFTFSADIIQLDTNKSNGPVAIQVRGNESLLSPDCNFPADDGLKTFGYRVTGDLRIDYDLVYRQERKFRQGDDYLFIQANQIEPLSSIAFDSSNVIAGFDPARSNYCHSANGNTGPYREMRGQVLDVSLALTRNNERQTNTPLWIKAIFAGQKSSYIDRTLNGQSFKGTISVSGPVYFKNWVKADDDGNVAKRIEVNVNVYQYKVVQNQNMRLVA